MTQISIGILNEFDRLGYFEEIRYSESVLEKILKILKSIVGIEKSNNRLESLIFVISKLELTQE